MTELYPPLPPSYQSQESTNDKQQHNNTNIIDDAPMIIDELTTPSPLFYGCVVYQNNTIIHYDNNPCHDSLTKKMSKLLCLRALMGAAHVPTISYVPKIKEKYYLITIRYITTFVDGVASYKLITNDPNDLGHNMKKFIDDARKIIELDMNDLHAKYIFYDSRSNIGRDITSKTFVSYNMETQKTSFIFDQSKTASKNNKSQKCVIL